VKKLNKKILGTVLALIVIIAVAAVAPALAHNKPDEESDSPAPGTQVAYYSGGDVTLQLPSPAVPSHHYNLRIVARDLDKRSYNGAEDYMVIYVWAPSYPGGGRFVPVALISDNQAGVDFVKMIYTGYLIGLSQNVIKVEDKELEVWKEDDVLMANLTKAIDIKIGDPAPQYGKDLNFTLPPLTLEFRGFDEVFKEEGAPTTIPVGTGKGWTSQSTAWKKPAWVCAWIPAWLGSIAYTTVGTFDKKVINTWTPPPAT